MRGGKKSAGERGPGFPGWKACATVLFNSFRLSNPLGAPDRVEEGIFHPARLEEVHDGGQILQVFPGKGGYEVEPRIETPGLGMAQIWGSASELPNRLTTIAFLIRPFYNFANDANNLD